MLPQAVGDHNEAVRLRPDYGRAYSDRGNALLVLGQFDQALEDYDQAIRLNPDHATTFGRRGALYERLGFVDQALADYHKMYNLGARPAWLEDKLGEYGVLEPPIPGGGEPESTAESRVDPAPPE